MSGRGFSVFEFVCYLSLRWVFISVDIQIAYPEVGRRFIVSIERNYVSGGLFQLCYPYIQH